MDQNKEESIKYPCPTKDGKYVTLEYCEHCWYKNKCDTYITMINEDLK